MHNIVVSDLRRRLLLNPGHRSSPLAAGSVSPFTDIMTDQSQPAPAEQPRALLFQSKSISIILYDGVPWFSLDDLCAAIGFTECAAERLQRRDFPDYAKRVVEEQTDEGWQPATVLSPIGVWLWGHMVDPGRSQGVAAWAKREALRLCPNPIPGDPAMCVSLMPDGELPPRPFKYSGRLSEWLDLRDSGAHLEARHARRSEEAQAKHSLMLRLLADGQARKDAEMAAATAPTVQHGLGEGGAR